MENVKKQSRIALRRMTFERFLSFLPWATSLALIVASVGIALPKLMVLEVEPSIWISSWVGGCLAVGLLTTFVLTWVGRPTLADAALEVDRRFELRERLSSSLVLVAEDRETELGQALAEDAERKASGLDVRDKFTWGFHGWLLAPVVPALLAAGLCLLNDQVAPVEQAQVEPKVSITKVKSSTESLLKQIKKKRKEAEEKNLTEAVDLFKQMEGELADLRKDAKLDTKQQLAKLNDIKQQLAERKSELGSADALRKNLQGLKKMESGPAEKLADALKDGDFEKSEEAVKELLEKMKEGSMSPSDQKKLEKQLDQLQKAMQEAQAGHEQAKQALQEQIAQAQAAGDVQKAAQLEKKLQEAQAQDGNMAQMAAMADKLAQAQKAMQQGNMQEAQDSLAEMAQQLGDMNMQDAELQDLDELMDELADSRSQMCQNEGSGMGMQQQQQQNNGSGMGEGAGSGARPEAEDDVDFFSSQVRDKMKKGEIVMGGKVGGANKKGVTRSEVQDAVLSAMSEEPEPLDNTPLPKMQREHTREYYNAIREGK